MKKEATIKLISAGALTAIGVILPVFFHMFSISGSIFLPMHIPVILCGFICGYKLGGISGLLTVLLSSLLTGMPPMGPVTYYMSAELIAYGVIGGILIKKTNVIAALITAMLGGRVVLAAAQVIILGLNKTPFALETFITSAFVKALPGIIIQIILIPIIMLSLKKANVLPGKLSNG